MIKDDTCFYFDLYEQLKAQRLAPVVILGLLPYLSLYVIETYRYFSDHIPSAADALRRNHEAIIRASRKRIKLLDDRRRTIDDFIEYHRAIVQVHRDWFMKGHTGFLGWLKRVLQPDLGIFTYTDKVIGTTHVAQLNLGQDPREEASPPALFSAEASSLAKSVGYDIGDFISTMLRVFPSSRRSSSQAAFLLDRHELQFQDVKSERFYRKTFKGVSNPSINATLVSLLTTANFAEEILGKLVSDCPTTYWKLKFVTLFHLTSSANTLQNYCYSKGLHSQTSKEFFVRILSDDVIREIKTKGQLRNLLVHYQIKEVPESALDEDKPLYGIPAYFLDGMTFKAADELISRQLGRLAGILNQWHA